jgi:chromate reductase, NAD(P)H dehydrogenase (quinone)
MKLFATIIFTLLIGNFAYSEISEIKVLAVAGSTRDDSVNKKLVTEAAHLARQMGSKVTIIDLKDYPMPLYDADVEANQGMPIKGKQLRQLMIQSQVILIASPEYNGSLSGVLKNAIDWASRSEEGVSSREAFKGKKFGIMSASPGSGGGSRGLVHLKQIIENIGGTVIDQQVVIPDAYHAFDEQGCIKNPSQKAQLQQQIQAAVH